jgi:hypothetical protein
VGYGDVAAGADDAAWALFSALSTSVPRFLPGSPLPERLRVLLRWHVFLCFCGQYPSRCPFSQSAPNPEAVGADIAMPRGGGNFVFVVPGGLCVNDRTVPGVLFDLWLQMY